MLTKSIRLSLLSYFFFCGIALSSHAQEVQLEVSFSEKSIDKDYIVYDAQNLLKISDFRGRPKPSSKAVAATNSGILMQLSSAYEGNKMWVQVQLLVYFDKGKSWMKEDGRNARVLAHEQLHMDITALHACILQQRFAQLKLRPNKPFDQLKTVYQQQMAEQQKMQNQYDRETLHGVNAEQQALWEQRIAEEMQRVSSACFGR